MKLDAAVLITMAAGAIRPEWMGLAGPGAVALLLGSMVLGDRSQSAWILRLAALILLIVFCTMQTYGKLWWST